ncbi:MAG: MotA/TolQ/ExbB proton channel family protein [Planctomycetota bacterium]
MLALHDVFWGRSLPELFEMGGPVMWPILACSVVAVAIIVERTIVFIRMGSVSNALEDVVVATLERGDFDGAKALCVDDRDPLGRIVAHQIELADSPEEVRREALQLEGGLVLEQMERRLSPLVLVAQISPLLGLLGTVSGLVASFWELEQITGPVEPSDLAAGIWAALMTTVFGLLVGIPASAASHLFQDRVDAFARRMGFTVTRIEGALWRASVSDEAAPTRPSAPRKIVDEPATSARRRGGA